MTYLKLVRWKNLLIIILTQVMLKYFIINPLMNTYGVSNPLPGLVFWILCLSTIFIAGAGYVINDIFDIQIDAVNKPSDKMIGKLISLEKARRFYWLINGAGLLTGLIIGILIDYINFVFIHLASAILLWYYSSYFKHKPLLGNILIAFLSAFSFYLLWMAELIHGDYLYGPYSLPANVSALVWGYTAFAFVMNILREIVKDIEDMDGDRAFGCRTLPLVFGANTARTAAVSVAMLIFVMTVVALVLMAKTGWFVLFGYFVLLIQLPLLWLTFRLVKARQKQHFHYVSGMIKLVMLTGVASMAVVYYTMKML